MSEILQYPQHEATLRKVAAPVETFDSSLKDLVKDLVESTKESGGLAVAAPQIGLDAAVFVYALPSGRGGVVINPEVVALSDDLWSYREGCLSIPGHFWWVNRPNTITIEYRDLKGNKQMWTDSMVNGRMLQHELDHLQGRLIVDLLSRYEKKHLAKELGR